MSRPKQIVKRDKTIKVRVTQLEKKWIAYSAGKAGLTISDFLRKSALNKEIRVRFTEEEIELYKTLQHYHTNFVRIGNYIKNNNNDLFNEIEMVKNEIKNVLKRFQE
jgi:hypothetical protein